MSYEIHLIGGGTVGRRITDRLESRGDSVVIIECDNTRTQWLRTEGYDVFHGDGTDHSTLEEAAVGDADIVVVATGDDDTNLLAAQLVRNRFSPDEVIVRVNRPANQEPFEDLGIQTVSQSDATAQLIDSHIESPALTQWMESTSSSGDVQEVAIDNEDLIGATISELDSRLPDQVLLVMVGESGTAHLPDKTETVNRGDHVTVLGTRNAVQKAIAELTNEEASLSDTETKERCLNG